jgi:hypothetical protein
MALFHRFIWRRNAAIVCLAVLAIALYWSIPRKADLRTFDPARMAVLETAMWRDYYDKRYANLFFNLYLSSRDEFGFSPLDSLKIALAAANAARTFQPTRSRDEANAALPALVTYYGLLARAAPARFDVDQAARLELDWWQARREDVPPEVYGKTIAATSAMLYGKSDELMLQSGVERAQAMAFRDQHRGDITDADWSAIELRLFEAYSKLRRSVYPPS